METLKSQVPSSETVPQFNPAGAPEDQVYGAAVAFEPGKGFSYRPHTDFEPDVEGVDIYRLEQRQRVAEGVGLVASRVMIEGSIGDIVAKDVRKHLTSNAAMRAQPEKVTPFVSFTTDPESLVKSLILKHGFGLRDGSDSVIVKARVHPSRLMSLGAGKQAEVLLVGGVAPTEYEDTHEMADFIQAHANEDEVISTDRVGDLKRDDAITKWREFAADAQKQVT